MSEVSLIRKRTIVRLALAFAAILAVGIFLSRSGWHGWASGQITVYRKLGPSFIAYAVGPHAVTFQFEVWLRIICGALFVLVGAGGPLGVVLASPSRREKVFLAATEAGLLKPQGVKVPMWLVVSILAALFAVFIHAATKVI